MKLPIEIYLWMKIIGNLLPVIIVVLLCLASGIIILWLIILGVIRKHRAKKLNNK